MLNHPRYEHFFLLACQEVRCIMTKRRGQNKFTFIPMKVRTNRMLFFQDQKPIWYGCGGVFVCSSLPYWLSRPSSVCLQTTYCVVIVLALMKSNGRNGDEEPWSKRRQRRRLIKKPTVILSSDPAWIINNRLYKPPLLETWLYVIFVHRTHAWNMCTHVFVGYTKSC